jgi:SNF2 family DNA or RNA helicase
MDTCEHGSIVKPGGIDVKQVIGKPVKQETTTNSSGSIIRSELADKHDSGFSQNLFAHQLEAVERYKDSSVIPLFLECGLGKTATVLKIVEYKFKRHEINALLVIAPNQVHNQWAKQEIPRWLDVPYDLQIIGGVGGQKVTRLFDTDPQMLQIVCTNVDTFSTKDKWKEIVEWALYNKTFIVLDEATSIKSIKAKRTERILYSFNKIAKRGKTIVSSVPLTPARAVLTGTPVTNGPMDLWSIMEFVQPNFFGRNWYSFQSYYSMFTSLNIADRVIKVPLTEDTWTSIKRILSYNEANYVFGISEDTFNTIHNQDHYEGPYKHADELKAKLDTVATFKRLKDCVDMPEQNYIVKELTMSSELKSCYDQMADEYIALYKEHTMTAQNKLTVLIRLQQLSSGFMLSKPQDDVSVETHDHVSDLFGLLDTQDVMPQEVVWIGSNNPKLEQLYSDVAEICKPLIIITRFTAEASRIYDELRDKYKVALFTGWKKVGTVQEFQRGEYEIMVANVAVVARGFNLQNANTILFYSNTYSLELRLQAEGRIYRIGQKNTCRYIDYAYKNSIDEKIVAALLMKRNLLEFLQSADIEDILEQTRVG